MPPGLPIGLFARGARARRRLIKKPPLNPGTATAPLGIVTVQVVLTMVRPNN